MIPHCGFDLHISNIEWCWASFHVFISHLYLFFGEMSVLLPTFWLGCLFSWYWAAYIMRPPLQHARLSCPSPSPVAYSHSMSIESVIPSNISSSVIPFSFCLQSFPASGSFPVSQVFASGGPSIGVSASAWVLLMNVQGWFPLGWTGLISIQSKGHLRVFSNTTIQLLVYFGD